MPTSARPWTPGTSAEQAGDVPAAHTPAERMLGVLRPVTSFPAAELGPPGTEQGVLSSSVLGQVRGPRDRGSSRSLSQSLGAGCWQPLGSDRWSHAPGDSACHAAPSGLIQIQALA